MLVGQAAARAMRGRGTRGRAGAMSVDQKCRARGCGDGRGAVASRSRCGWSSSGCCGVVLGQRKRMALRWDEEGRARGGEEGASLWSTSMNDKLLSISQDIFTAFGYGVLFWCTGVKCPFMSAMRKQAIYGNWINWADVFLMFFFHQNMTRLNRLLQRKFICAEEKCSLYGNMTF